MKRTIYAFFAITLLLCNYSVSAIAETWKVTSLDWQPYSGSDMSNQGNSILKLKNLLKVEGIELVVEFYPWKRSQVLAGQKEYIGYFPAWPEEVGKGFVASAPVDWSNLGVLTNMDSDVEWKDIEELFKNIKVGIVGTYGYPDNIQQLMKKYPKNVDTSPDETALVKKLSANRIQAALTDPAVMMYLAQKEGIKNVKILNESIEKKPLVFAFREGEDNLKRIEILNRLSK